ncbi:Low-density lipoprotein receptor- protein 1B [Homalodisca vitripennis]|nr:Low-density lipoprotein receptor- protein 1B [Homalodisca vitripennis]
MITTRLSLVIFCLLYGGGGKNTEAIYVSRRNEIVVLEKSSSSPVVMVSSDFPIVAFDIHQFWRQIIWATDYHIYRTPLYDLQTTTEIAATGEVGGLAVDWVHHEVYWSDTTISRLEAARLDGSARRIVYEAEWPISSLVVDPELGKLFWLESSQVGSRMKRIKTSNLYGSHIKTIYVDSNIYEFSPLAINVIKKNLNFYKFNGSFSEQWAVNYGRIMYAIKLFEKEEPVPRSFELSANGFFYSNSDGLMSGTWKNSGNYTLIYDNTKKSVSRVTLHRNVVDKDLSEATQIRLVGKTKPRWQDQECRFHDCQHACVPSGKDRPTCACGYGYTLMDDKKSCSENGKANVQD